ncbi:MAG TPA: hypothetical protein VFY13_01845 [Luteolibacter sp.]|nr:hypothetical protein [Luteolibacter sp.]
MTKTKDQILLLPGPEGWEVWLRREGGGFELHSATEHRNAGELRELPAGEVAMLFGVGALTAMPLRVPSGDEALYADMAAMHAERLGLKADPLGGQLSDLFVVERDEQGAILLSVLLKAPGEGDLPPASPNGFDLSARALPLEGDKLVLWRELGRWVFALRRAGQLLYFQATTSDSAHPDEGVAREIQLALMQLSIQGLLPGRLRVMVWSAQPDCDLSVLQRLLDLPIETGPRPAPMLPEPASRLLPEDVRAARQTQFKRRRIKLAGIAAALVYLLFVSWQIVGLWSVAHEVNQLEKSAAQVAPEADAYELHMARWRELADVVDPSHAPVEILHRISSCIPAQGGLRLKLAEISSSSVTLVGEAPELQAVNRFSLNLSKHSGLSRFQWNLPDARQPQPGSPWEFRYQGELPVTTAP